MSLTHYDVVIVGGGAVGLSTAYKLLQRYPDLKLAVLEKEPAVAAHQTGNNSGVIHSGIYYKPGSLKAKNCINGRVQLVEFCQTYDIKHEVCGKIIVATQEDELPRLDKIFETGLQNGLSSIRKIDGAAIKDYEPYCVGLAAIHVPYTGIVDFKGVCFALQRLIDQHPHAHVFTDHEVKSIRSQNGDYILKAPKQNFKCRYLITCGGLYAEHLAKLEGLKTPNKIVPFRGDYYDLTPQALHKVRNLIYPVANPAFPFLGVHFTRMVDGTIECGPNAVFSFKREGYRKTDFSFKDALQALSYKGTWTLFSKHWRFGLDEYRRAFSKKLFLERLQRLIPSLTMADITPGRAGVRAMLLTPDGQMVDDFSFVQNDRAIHVLNAPSPAATACLAIGEEIMLLAEQQFSLK